MSKFIMVGCDLHDKNMLLRYAIDTNEPQQWAFKNNPSGRRDMIARLKSLAKKHHVQRIIFVYEASGLGHGLSDQLFAEGIECYVLSPTHLPKSAKSARLKTDAKDAQMLLEQLRGFVLAGNTLPVVWTPPQCLRDDRELVRARIDVADEISRVKLKIDTFLKNREIKIVSPTKCRWTKAFVRWIVDNILPKLKPQAAIKLRLLLNRLELFRREKADLDKALRNLSRKNRYKVACAKLCQLPGVGLLAAMTFLTEMGDLNRFDNRRQVGAYLGLCPASNESGEINDRKGRITRQGSARLRKILCQAAWTAVRRDAELKASYLRIKQGQAKRSKKAIVAIMRKLGIKMWHAAVECGVSSELEGRPRPLAADIARVRQRDACPPSHQSLSCAG